jgi:hypothetical protein
MLPFQKKLKIKFEKLCRAKGAGAYIYYIKPPKEDFSDFFRGLADIGSISNVLSFVCSFVC